MEVIPQQVCTVHLDPRLCSSRGANQSHLGHDYGAGWHSAPASQGSQLTPPSDHLVKRVQSEFITKIMSLSVNLRLVTREPLL